MRFCVHISMPGFVWLEFVHTILSLCVHCESVQSFEEETVFLEFPTLCDFKYATKIYSLTPIIWTMIVKKLSKKCMLSNISQIPTLKLLNVLIHLKIIFHKSVTLLPNIFFPVIIENG